MSRTDRKRSWLDRLSSGISDVVESAERVASPYIKAGGDAVRKVEREAGKKVRQGEAAVADRVRRVHAAVDIVREQADDLRAQAQYAVGKEAHELKKKADHMVKHAESKAHEIEGDLKKGFGNKGGKPAPKLTPRGKKPSPQMQQLQKQLDDEKALQSNWLKNAWDGLVAGELQKGGPEAIVDATPQFVGSTNRLRDPSGTIPAGPFYKGPQFIPETKEFEPLRKSIREYTDLPNKEKLAQAQKYIDPHVAKADRTPVGVYSREFGPTIVDAVSGMSGGEVPTALEIPIADSPVVAKLVSKAATPGAKGAIKIGAEFVDKLANGSINEAITKPKQPDESWGEYWARLAQAGAMNHATSKMTDAVSGIGGNRSTTRPSEERGGSGNSRTGTDASGQSQSRQSGGSRRGESSDESGTGARADQSGQAEQRSRNNNSRAAEPSRHQSRADARRHSQRTRERIHAARTRAGGRRDRYSGDVEY